ncbi:MAG: signal transduction histidine kinase [Variovorax sp.]|jgi:two-component sensor histidine kinase|nr:signal transduction histidine kinase [Variovorax sp.]
MAISALAVLRATSGMRKSAKLAYSLALVVFLLALAVRFMLNGHLGHGFPFLTFFPAILLTTLFAGRGPGYLCALLSVLAAWFWFVGTADSFTLDTEGAVALAFFAFVAIADVMVIDFMTQALDKVELLWAETDALVAQRTTLFQELQHRVANNLMTVATALAVEERRLRHLPEAVESFRKVRHRFEMLSRIHRELHDPANAEVQFGPYIQKLCDEFLKALDATNIRCVVDACDVAFDADRTVTLSLLTLEVITNALKHAFAPGDAGTITVRLFRSTERASELVLIVQDDGCGLKPEFDFTHGERLGLGILSGLARALRGRISVNSATLNKGTIVQVSFPFAAAVASEMQAKTLGIVTALAVLPTA